jgi:hypothetical protein
MDLEVSFERESDVSRREQVRQELLKDVLPYFEAIVNVTRPLCGESPNRCRALARQIARNALQELRAPRLVRGRRFRDA